MPTLCHDGAKAPDTPHRTNLGLVLLGLMLPGLDGVEVYRLICSGSDVPVIMLAMRTDTQDVIAGSEAGTDDYMIEPFKSKGLPARISARLHCTSPGAAEHMCAGDLDIDVVGHQVKRGESVISLALLEFELLVTLARSPWGVLARGKLLSRMWGYQHPAGARLVNVYVQRLRTKTEKDPEHPSIVVTVRSVGYRVDESA